jgi:hypothetical protein
VFCRRSLSVRFTLQFLGKPQYQSVRYSLNVQLYRTSLYREYRQAVCCCKMHRVLPGSTESLHVQSADQPEGNFTPFYIQVHKTTILIIFYQVKLDECATWSLTLRKGRTPRVLRVFVTQA